MEAAGTAHRIKLAPQAGHPVADHPAIRFDLRFARTAKEAETAALALQVGPAAHQTPRLIIKVREFNLQSTFGRAGAFAKDFQDQPGAVDYFDLELFLKIALLDGRQRAIDDDKFAQQVLLSGQVNDLQGRLNVTNLLQGEQLDAKTTISFERLFDALGVPPAQLNLLTQGLLAAQKQTSNSPGCVGQRSGLRVGMAGS